MSQGQILIYEATLLAAYSNFHKYPKQVLLNIRTLNYVNVNNKLYAIVYWNLWNASLNIVSLCLFASTVEQDH